MLPARAFFGERTEGGLLGKSYRLTEKLQTNNNPGKVRGEGNLSRKKNG